MKYQKETVNEHIRNAVQPLVGLLDLLESKGDFANMRDEDKEKFLKIFIQSGRHSIKLLSALGMDVFEPEDSMYNKIKNHEFTGSYNK